MSAKKNIKSTTYLRKIEIHYRKRRASSKSVEKITGPKQVVELFNDLQNETKEKLISISLGAKGKIFCFEVVAIGSVSAIYMRPAEALKASIVVSASSVVLVHNHPSGDPDPSPEDKKFTKDLKVITDACGFEFLDHIIIAEEGYYSFCEDGKLSNVINPLNQEKPNH